ncbi:hypothetical protein Pmani_009680 [Petrolisthes manimaculis]|uniref:Uncharacterized protein n=1 Tax=Petrolisthes manimaculis TaxID=1843537 RepID=A0AAE1Q4G9_9EUCA|nr:hypothetical protein Pmani_009680 [Petrolisthes manimaculis]
MEGRHRTAGERFKSAPEGLQDELRWVAHRGGKCVTMEYYVRWIGGLGCVGVTREWEKIKGMKVVGQGEEKVGHGEEEVGHGEEEEVGHGEGEVVVGQEQWWD